jgi:putative NADH-flavin reductase
VRNPGKATVSNPYLTVVKADVLKDTVDDLVDGHDPVISAYNRGWIQIFTVTKSRAIRQLSAV